MKQCASPRCGHQNWFWHSCRICLKLQPGHQNPGSLFLAPPPTILAFASRLTRFGTGFCAGHELLGTQRTFPRFAYGHKFMRWMLANLWRRAWLSSTWHLKSPLENFGIVNLLDTKCAPLTLCRNVGGTAHTLDPNMRLLKFSCQDLLH